MVLVKIQTFLFTVKFFNGRLSLIFGIPAVYASYFGYSMYDIIRQVL